MLLLALPAADAPEAPEASDSMNMMSDVTPNCAAESIEQPLPSQSIALTLSERLKRVRFPHFVSNIQTQRPVVFFRNRTSNAPVRNVQRTTIASARIRVNSYRPAARPVSEAATQTKATMVTSNAINPINF